MTLLNNPTQGNVLPYLIGGQLYYFIPYYVGSGSSANVITKLAFMAVVDASNGVSAYGPSSAQAFTSLLSSENVTAPSTTGLGVNDVAHAFSSDGYTVTLPASVNVNVGYLEGTISLANATSTSLDATVSGFLAGYAAPLHASTVYEWTSGSDTYFGVITSVSGVVTAYYVEVTP